jgi:hypothetical protein
MPCEEKSRLLSLYTVALARFSVNTEDLNRVHGRTSKEEYDRLRSVSRDAWTSAESARLDLEGMGTHEC